MNNIKETTIDYVAGDGFATIFTSEKKYISKLRSYAKKTEECKIICVNSDGSVLAHVPVGWVKFPSPKAKRNFTEEQRKAISERMKGRKKSSS